MILLLVLLLESLLLLLLPLIIGVKRVRLSGERSAARAAKDADVSVSLSLTVGASLR